MSMSFLLELLRTDGVERERMLGESKLAELEMVASSIRVAYAGYGKDEPQHFEMLRRLERQVSGWLKIKRENIPAPPPVVVSPAPTAPKPKNGWNPPSRRLAVTR